MAVDIWGVAQLVFISIIITLLSFQIVKRNAKPLKLVVLSLNFAWVRALLSLIMNPNRDIWNVKGEFQLLFLILTMVSLYTFFEYTLNDKPLVRRALIIYGLTGFYLGFYIIALSTKATENGVNWPFAPEIPFWQLPVDLIQVVVYTFGVYTFLRMARYSNNSESRKLSLALALAFLLLLFSAIMELTEYFTGNQFSQTITTFPAFIILLIVYTYHPYFSYSSPVKVYRLLVILDGLTIIEENFAEKYRSGTNAGPLLGGITASINSLFRELTQV